MSPFVTTRRPGRRVAAAVSLASGLLGSSLLVSHPATAASEGPVDLGTATSFAVLAGAGITNTGPTTITGDVGTFPTTTRSGFSSVTLTGTDHGGDAVTQGAKDALVTAYDDAFGRTPATPTPVELGGSTLLAGVYTSPTFGLTGTLTLDAENRDDAQFVFQAGSTLIAEANSRVVLLNGASPCNVVWQVGSSATFKTGTRFTGDVLAYMSITAQTSATFEGRLLAREGAVTLDTNTISNAACAAAAPSGTPSPAAESPSASPSASPPAPAPMTSPAPQMLPEPVTTGGGPVTARAAPPAAVLTPPARPAAPPVAAGLAVPVVPVVPAQPTLPETGFKAWLAVAGLALLAAGCACQVAGRRRRFVGRHEKRMSRPYGRGVSLRTG